MNKKKILIMPIFIIFIVGIIIIIKQYNKIEKNPKEHLKTYQTSSYLIPETLENINIGATGMVDLIHEYTPEYMLEISDAVTIASIISLDGADTKYNQSIGYTYGKLVINNTIYGNIIQGEVINYMKPGGIMSLDEYDRYQIDKMREKHQTLREDAGIDGSKIYQYFHYQNDPRIEEGKTYLCYLKYIEKLGKYEIIGLGNGFREVNIPKSNIVSDKKLDLSLYKILNNNTGKYESLEDYINKNIK